MKIYCSLLLIACACITSAQAASQNLSLPVTQHPVFQVPGTQSATGASVIYNAIINNGQGVYAGGNNNTISSSSWGTNNEGYWTVDTNNEIGTITLLNRNAVGGSYFALGIEGPTSPNSPITSFNFSFSIDSGATGGGKALFTVYDIENDTFLSGLWKTVDFTSDGGTINVTMDKNDIDLIGPWNENYLLVAGATFNGGSGGSTASYTVSDIKVTFSSEDFPDDPGNIPEPATASLSLLGLAALMMRRRRRTQTA